MHDDFNKELQKELDIVYKYLIKKGIHKVDAEDAVQETACKFLIYYPTIKSTKIRSWLIRVALNYHLDQCRKQNKLDFIIDEAVIQSDTKEEPELEFLQKERAQDLKYALGKLKPLYQELLLLKYYSELSYEEISHIIGKKISYVKTNLFRARKKLLKIYKEVTTDDTTT
ncbi:RNA polymerase sigma factor SigM [Paraliobacillus sp. PM-2]|uniref:RNA polymerase sigma factor n=1 Tax=Paraliobacillus sp. PM-2 TaxID=1462524 RepID=UPI00061C0627|nr:sigma-70 family RNA polymerase sigma factor [Paraliobacillus sp. PM-2]CQR47184.1 RNA polymerase sigma factor SigM [Paraliobacillus sp. PM-2]